MNQEDITNQSSMSRLYNNSDMKKKKNKNKSNKSNVGRVDVEEDSALSLQEEEEEEEEEEEAWEEVERIRFGSKWKRLSNMKTPRVGCAAVSVSKGRYVIVVGGRSSASGETLATAEGYDFEDPEETCEWTTISRPMSMARSFCCAASIEQSLDDQNDVRPLVVVMGGQNAEGKALSDVESLDLKTHRWRRLPSMIVRRTKCSCVVTQGRRIVVVGGQDESGRALDSCEYLDLDFTRRPQWTLMTPSTLVGRVGKSSLSAVVTGEGDLLVLGGATLEIQVLINDEWRLLPKQLWLGSLRNRCQVVPVGTSTLLVLGGSSGGRNGAKDSVEALDLMQLTWTQPPPPSMTTPRHSFGATTCDNRRIVAMGGYDKNNKALDSVEVLEMEVVPPEIPTLMTSLPLPPPLPTPLAKQPPPQPQPQPQPKPQPKPKPKPQLQPKPQPAAAPPAPAAAAAASSSLSPSTPVRPPLGRSTRRRASGVLGGAKGVSLAEVVCESMNPVDHRNAASSLRLESARAAALQKETDTPPPTRSLVPAVHAKAMAPLPSIGDDDDDHVDDDFDDVDVDDHEEEKASVPHPPACVTRPPPMLVLPALPPPPPPPPPLSMSLRGSENPSQMTAHAVATSRARAAELEAWSEKVRKLTEGVQHMTAIHMEECVAQRDDLLQNERRNEQAAKDAEAPPAKGQPPEPPTPAQEPEPRRAPRPTLRAGAGGGAEETFQKSIRHIQSNAGHWAVRAQAALEKVELELESLYQSMAEYHRLIQPPSGDGYWEPTTPPPSRPTKPRLPVRSRSIDSASTTTTTTTAITMTTVTNLAPPPPLPTAAAANSNTTTLQINVKTNTDNHNNNNNNDNDGNHSSNGNDNHHNHTRNDKDNDAARPSHLPIPKDLRCPLTGRLMEDPVIASDGFTYERAAMEQWISLHLASGPMVLSPSTEKELTSNTLIPNLVLQSLIRSYKTHVLKKRNSIVLTGGEGGGGGGG